MPPRRSLEHGLRFKGRCMTYKGTSCVSHTLAKPHKDVRLGRMPPRRSLEHRLRSGRLLVRPATSLDVGSRMAIYLGVAAHPPLGGADNFARRGLWRTSRCPARPKLRPDCGFRPNSGCPRPKPKKNRVILGTPKKCRPRPGQIGSESRNSLRFQTSEPIGLALADQLTFTGGA